MNFLTLLVPLALAACATWTLPEPSSSVNLTAPTATTSRPIVITDVVKGRWTFVALNSRPVSGPWLEFDRGSARYRLACNGGVGIVVQTGDKLSINPASLTEMGCDQARHQIDEEAVAVLRGAMTMKFTPPDRLRLSNRSGTIDLVRPPPTAVSAAPYRALGTEPFWALTIDSREIVFTEANAPGVQIVEPLPKVIHGFAGDIYQGKRIGVNIVRTPCSDGMSERVYPHQVQLRVDGRSFEGCGGLAVGGNP